MVLVFLFVAVVPFVFVNCAFMMLVVFQTYLLTKRTKRADGQAAYGLLTMTNQRVCF
jgi:hypothetical protein